ncbi:MAG: Jag N-terminal domain-containing protein [Deferribacterales bacterium]
MKYFEIEGKTAEAAVANFLAENNIPKDFVTYETLEEGSKGFLGFGSKNALIKIKFNDAEYFKRKGRLILAEMLEKAGFHECTIETKHRHPDVIFNIISPDSKLLIGKNAQTLDAMQFLLNRMVSWEESEGIFIVDVEDYRDRVVEQLKDKAIKLAKTVRRTGKPIKMAPMVTMVRKEIHIALKQIKGINTVSKGEGHLKEILIVPDRKTSGPRRPYRDRNENQTQNNNSEEPAAKQEKETSQEA